VAARTLHVDLGPEFDLAETGYRLLATGYRRSAATTMTRFVLGRLALMLPTLLLLALVTFFLGYLSPSDPIEIMLGQHANPEAAARLRKSYGLDRPPLVQFGAYLAGALHGDLGRSYYDQKPVT